MLKVSIGADYFILVLFIIDSIVNLYIGQSYQKIFIRFIVFIFFQVAYIVLGVFHLRSSYEKELPVVTIFGVLRLVRVFLLICFIYYFSIIPLKGYNKVEKKEDTGLPVERIMKTLNEIKNKIPLHEKRLIEELDYATDIISKNKIFTPHILMKSNTIKTQNVEQESRIKEEVNSKIKVDLLLDPKFRKI